MVIEGMLLENSRFNSRKLQVLAYVASVYSCTAREISNDLGLEIHNARTLLKRYWKQRLLGRQKCETGEFVYYLTERGRKRLEFLQRQFGWYA